MNLPAGEGLALRPMADGDLRAIAETYMEAVHALAVDHYDEAQRHAWAPRTIDLDRWRDRLEGLHVRVAERDGRVLGFVAWNDEGYLDLLYTHPDAARTGIATRLVEAVEQDTRRRGVPEVWARASDVSKLLFEHLGYAPGEEQWIEVRGETLRNTVVRKVVVELDGDRGEARADPSP